MCKPRAALALKLSWLPGIGFHNPGWDYIVTLPAVKDPVYAIAGRYGHGGLYVLQDRSREFLSQAGLLAKGQTVHVCAGPRFIKLHDYKKKNTVYWPTLYGRHKLGYTDLDFRHLFEEDGVTPCGLTEIIVPGTREWLAYSSISAIIC